jgi:UDP-glucuronate decarboxylase
MLEIKLLEFDGIACLENVKTELLVNKTIMITGASGIVGTHFLYSLKYAYYSLKIPFHVIAIANKGVPEHLQALNDEELITFLIGDLTDDHFLQKLPKADIVIHAATYGQPGKFMEHPEKTVKLNTTVTLFLLENILTKTGKFLFISSSEVYSGLLNPPYYEEQIGSTTPNHPRACYIEAKRCGEAIINIFRRKGASAVSARLSLAYGPGTRHDDRRVLNNFIKKALVEKKIKLLDEGIAKRTYCYVSDAINMMWKILLEGKAEVYNIGGVSSVAIAELAKLIGEITNVPVLIPKIGSKGISGAPEEVRLDISRYISEFGECSFLDLNQGLRNTIEWQQSMYLNTKKGKYSDDEDENN